MLQLTREPSSKCERASEPMNNSHVEREVTWLLFTLFPQDADEEQSRTEDAAHLPEDGFCLLRSLFSSPL